MISNASVSVRASTTAVLAASWCTDLMTCDFHISNFGIAASKSCWSSSRFSSLVCSGGLKGSTLIEAQTLRLEYLKQHYTLSRCNGHSWCYVGVNMSRGTLASLLLSACCGIFYCVWNISASAGSINNQDCIFHFLRFIAFVHSYITIVLNVLLNITMLTSFIATTSKRFDYVCPAANRTWQRLTIIFCDLTHERDTYFLNISHIIYLNYYLPRINRLQSKPLI